MPDDFFSGVLQTEFDLGEYKIPAPTFYRDCRFFMGLYPARLAEAKRILPDKRFSPAQIIPGVAAASLTALEYRDTDIGPYNEFGVGIALNSPQFAAIPGYNFLRQTPQMYSYSYLKELPVTTNIALIGGLAVGFPKFMASIEFSDTDDWLTCEVKEGEDHICTLRGRKIPAPHSDQMKMFPHFYQNMQPQWTEFKVNAREYGVSFKQADLELSLGSHRVSDKIRRLFLSTKPLMYSYVPSIQGILYAAEHITMNGVKQLIDIAQT